MSKTFIIFTGFKDVKAKSYMINLFELARNQDMLKGTLSY